MSNRCGNFSRYCGCIVVSLAMSLMASVTFASTRSTITMEDLLHAERIGDAQFAPGSRGAFAFIRGIPIAEQASWGYAYANLVRSRVFVVAHSGAEPKEIPNTADVHYTLIPRNGSWSPDGHKLLLIATTRSGYGLAIYDLSTEKIMKLPGRISSFFPLFDWTGDGRLIYYTIPAYTYQRGADAQVLDNIEARWSAAWNGDSPQVTVSSTSPVFETSTPPLGALMLANPRDGSIRRIATGDYYAIAVSPDERHVAVVCAAERLSSSVNISSQRGELQILDLNAQGQVSLQYRYPDIDTVALTMAGNSLAWSPSGDRLLTVGTPAGKGRSDTNLYVVDVDNGRIDTLEAPKELSFVNTTISAVGLTLPMGWVGDRPVAVAAHRSEAATSDSSLQAKTHVDYGGIHGWRFDVYVFGTDRPARNLTTFAKASVNQFLTASSGSGLLVVADGALWKLVPGQKPTRLTQQDAPRILGFGGGGSSPMPVPDSAYFRTPTQERVGLTALVDGEPKRVVLDIKSGELTRLAVRGDIVSTAPNQLETLSKLDQGWTSTLLLNDMTGKEHVVLGVNVALKDKVVAKVKPFKFTYEEKPLVGWVVLPPHAKPGVPLPAVVSVYGGAIYGAKPPRAAEANPGFPLLALSGQLLAAQGYAVIFPSTPVGQGSTTNVMATLAGEAVKAADALATKGIIDPQRVGVVGQSFGGYSTAAILAERSDYFIAGVSMAGIYGWIASYGMLRMDQILGNDGNIPDLEIRTVENGQIRLGKPFWKAPEAYMRNSPIFHVEDINAPLLMLHGDMDLADTGLPVAMRMYNALLRAGGDKQFALVRYWGQGHVAQSAWAIRDQWSRITHWFDHYLKSDAHAVEAGATGVPGKAD